MISMVSTRNTLEWVVSLLVTGALLTSYTLLTKSETPVNTNHRIVIIEYTNCPEYLTDSEKRAQSIIRIEGLENGNTIRHFYYCKDPEV